jgi:hypothetical protein
MLASFQHFSAKALLSWRSDRRTAIFDLSGTPFSKAWAKRRSQLFLAVVNKSVDNLFPF